MPILLPLLLVVISVPTDATIRSRSAARPINLVVDETAQGPLFHLVGRSDVPCRASYRLDVDGGPGGGNRSSQGGTVVLQPGTTVRLAQVQLGASAREQWSARLTVRPCAGEEYQELRQAQSR